MNLATIANSRIGRPVLIYTFGAACLQVLKQTRTVIEMGFGIIDAKLAEQPQIPAGQIDAQPPTPPPAGDPTSDLNVAAEAVAGVGPFAGDELPPPPPAE